MIKLQFSKPHYHTYNDGKTTVCSFDCKVYDTKTNHLIRIFKVSGKADCHPKDIPDSHIGAMIAESKAKYNAYKIAQATYSQCTICEMIEDYKAINEVLSFYSQMQYLKKSEDKHVKHLCKNEICN